MLQLNRLILALAVCICATSLFAQEIAMVELTEKEIQFFDEEDIQKDSDPETDELYKVSSEGENSFNVNPLGFLQFGPIFQYEVALSDRTYIVPYFRYAFAGVVTHAAWTGFEEDSELSAGTAALGLGLKSYAQDGNSMYYGGFLDFSWGTARYDVSEIDATEEKATNLGLISNFGYQWRTGDSSYLNLGLYAGASFTLKDEERYINTGELYASYNEVVIFAMLELSFGWDL
ncbi:hypothetical protein [Ekhidna sp.]|uniref:hypothetical protein n=1 Tax=Ekhidna sp. TaxID=2608089 RepID=UPI0032EB214E